MSSNWEWRFHTLMVVAACGAVAISVYGHLQCQMTLSLTQAAPTFLILLVVLAGAAQYRWRNAVKCFQVMMMVFWALVITNFHFFPMYMAARQDVPMSDALLAAMDRQLGVEVPTVLSWLEPYPGFKHFMFFAYATLIPLMTVATVLPPMLDRMDKAKEYAVGCIIAASLVMPIFACFQAVGPWDYYRFPPPIESLSAKADMLAYLKTDGWFLIDVTNRDGLITFPSFHVVLTVLAAAALWPMKWIRWPVAIWAGMIVVSTVTTGIHYTTDVLGGLVLAGVAWLGARGYLHWESRAGVRNPVDESGWV